ncbi:MAG: hypothetical protein ACI4U3_08865 [Traorella sp.]
MEIDITCGQYANDYLEKHHPGNFIPFNEAMIYPSKMPPLFCEDFILDRIECLHTTFDDYFDKMHDFIQFTHEYDHYSTITLWFGFDDFCIANLLVILEFLKLIHYQGKTIIQIINEDTYEVIYANLTPQQYYDLINKRKHFKEYVQFD